MINALPELSGIADDKTASQLYQKLEKLIGLLNQKDLPDTVTGQINELVTQIPKTATNIKQIRKVLRTTTSKISDILRKEMGLVRKDYYRSLWMSLGMTIFGLPIGVAIGTAVDNLGLLAVGLPIGMFIGIVIGAGMDRKAAKEGKQLAI